MSVIQLRQEWVEVWSGVPVGDTKTRWFVDHFYLGGRLCVSDRETEEEALADAREYDLPIIRI